MDDQIDYSNLEFHERLGEGGFGSVNRVTFKTPCRGYTEAAAKSVVDFRKEEVEILAKLSHPHVVSLIGFYQNGPVKIILLEVALRGSLHDFLSDGSKPLPDELKRKWIRESALGVQYLHANNCLHRDIKANNCLLFDDNVLKLCDFGLARETNHSVTMSSQKGTYQYMAPELINTDDRNRTPYSRFADIYAYGMLVLEICTRKPPFYGMDYAYIIYGVGSGTLQPSVPADCPKDLADLMKTCWSDNPRRRPTIDNVVEILGGTNEGVLVSGKLENEMQVCRLHATSAIDHQPWQAKKEIHPINQSLPIRADIVACCPNGDLVIADVSKLYLYGTNGKSKMLMTPADASYEEQIGYISGLAVSSKGHVFAVDNTKFVKVFTSNGKFSHCFSTESIDYPTSRAGIELSCVAMDRNNRILVGDRWRGIVTIHKCPSGDVINTVGCSFVLNCNNSIFVNSKRQIMCHFQSNEVSHKLVAIDYSGSGKSATVTLNVPEGMSVLGVWQRGIACDNDDNLYLSMKVDLGSKIVNAIHKYSPTGDFLGCITDRIYFPYNMSVTSDGSSLVVANDKSVLFYSLNIS